MTVTTTQGLVRAARRPGHTRLRAAGYLASGLAIAVVAFARVPQIPVHAQTTPSVSITEVHPSGSGNGTYAADWFEITNTGATPLDIAGWRVDDDSNAFGSSVALRGVTTIPAGRSAVFFEGNASGSTDAAIITRSRRPGSAARRRRPGSSSAPTAAPASA